MWFGVNLKVSCCRMTFGIEITSSLQFWYFNSAIALQLLHSCVVDGSGSCNPISPLCMYIEFVLTTPNAHELVFPRFFDVFGWRTRHVHAKMFCPPHACNLSKGMTHYLLTPRPRALLPSAAAHLRRAPPLGVEPRNLQRSQRGWSSCFRRCCERRSCSFRSRTPTPS